MDSDIALLYDEMTAAIDSATSDAKIGVAFSGGVDSSLIARLCSDMGYDITLLTVGFEDSHDINFAKTINQIYNFKHEILEIQNESFQKVYPFVRKKINTDNLSWNENSIAFYYVSELAKRLGVSTVITANGIDELFCGYNAYRVAFSDGPAQITRMIDAKLQNELLMFDAVNSVAADFGVCILQPLLHPDFITYAKTIPLSQKITGPDDLMRKHIIRRLASQCGVPELACQKRKKALQYGSNIHKKLLKSR